MTVDSPNPQPAFDVDFYRRAYPDLSGLTPAHADAHWTTSGFSEGRIGSFEQLTSVFETSTSRAWAEWDVVEYIVATPELIDSGVTTYERAMVNLIESGLAGDEIRSASIPRAFVDALESAACAPVGMSKRGLFFRAGAQRENSWSYSTTKPDRTIEYSPLAAALESVSQDAFLAACFRYVVGRVPTSRDIDFWNTQLDSRTFARAAVLADLFRQGPLDPLADNSGVAPDEVATRQIAKTVGIMSHPLPGATVKVLGVGVITPEDWAKRAKAAKAAMAANSATTLASLAGADPVPTRPAGTADIEPSVSVLVSLFRSESYLAAWIANVEALDGFDEYEFLVVAVQPNDVERQLLESFSKHRHVVVDIVTEPLGLYAAWNRALSASRGEFITNMNVDDARAPRSIARQLEILRTYDWIDVVSQDVLVSLEPNVHWSQLEQIAAQCALPMTTLSRLLTGMNPPHNAPMWRRTLHDRVGTFDETLSSAADLDFWIRSALAGAVFYNVPDAHVGYFQNPHGLSTSSAGASFAELSRVLERYVPNAISRLGARPTWVSVVPEFAPPRSRTERTAAGIVTAIGKSESRARRGNGTRTRLEDMA